MRDQKLISVYTKKQLKTANDMAFCIVNCVTQEYFQFGYTDLSHGSVNRFTDMMLNLP